MVTLSTWRDRMSEDMRLRDFRPRTQEAYLATARQFVDWVGKEPVDVAEDDVRRYFLFLRETKLLAPSSINLAVHALRFFLTHTLQRDWAVLELLRVNKPRRLPVVLSTGETRALLGAIRHPVRRVALATIYALGLRLNEGLALEAGVTLRTIQQVLGHKSLRTTEVYMHVTQPGTERLQETLDRLMAGL